MRDKDQVTYKGRPTEFSVENMEVRRAWTNAIQVMKEQSSNPDYYAQKNYQL